MATVKLYKQSGDDKAKEIQQRLEKRFGFLPETFQAMGRNGEFLDAMLNLQQKAGQGLDSKTKELIAIAVSAVNGCEYCVQAHRATALRSGATEEEITAAIEVAAMMSAFNKFNLALGLSNDIAPKKP